MNNRNRKNNKSSGSVGIAVIAAIMVLNAVTDSASGSVIVGLIFTVLFLGILGFVIAYALSKKKGGATKGSVYYTERVKENAKHIFMREEYDEQAIKCAHPRGREKYIHQLDNFLSIGLIDRKEYQLLKERYDKLNIPENMH